ncbi:MAG: histidine decarboxylase [Lacibacter sp.]
MDHNLKKVSEFISFFKERQSNFIGYPSAVDQDYSELFPLMNCYLNNIGDPMINSHFEMHTKWFEREVLNFFADLFKAPTNNWWGYITNGGSEGNLYGLYLARELYKEAIVYYSEATHYSIQKNIHLLGIPSIVIRAKENGEMDYDDLKDILQHHRLQPAIILANIGTTMTEAKDHLPSVKKALNTYAIRNYYIHCDAALAGTYLALMDKGHFDFSYGADSIAISGHKFIGSPMPCGVVLVKNSHKERISKSVSYIGSNDTTISGSRNAITPVFLWRTIEKLGKQGLLQRASSCIELAAYTVHQLNASGIKAWRNDDALTVIFPQPNHWICNKWQLASENGFSHLICMPGVTKNQIDRFIHDCTA